VHLTVDMRFKRTEIRLNGRIFGAARRERIRDRPHRYLTTRPHRLRLDTTNMGNTVANLPPILQRTVVRLKELETAGSQGEEARQALLYLYELVKEVV